MSPRNLFLAGTAALACGVFAGLALSQVAVPPIQQSGTLASYNTVAPTYTSGQAGWVQMDANGNMKVAIASGGGTGGTASTFGVAFPATGTAIGFTDGTNMVAARVGAITNLAAATNLVDTNPACQYNATPLTVTDTRYQGPQRDVNGYLITKVNNANANGQATMANSSPVVIASNQTSVPVLNGASAYETVAASQTAQALGATGGTGDYLSHCVIYPTSTTPGVVTVFDNTNAAGTNVIAFPGGASSVS